MPIVVQKYGGSSVADVEKIRKVAAKVAQKREAGYQVVVVVSAMGDTTDELLSLAKQVSADPPRRELDMLLTCGERISMALLSMALQEAKVPAISFTGSQSGIITTDAHSQARIIEVRPYRLLEELEKGKVVIVAGYQGVSEKREVTTLGRGGSDTTAVALAAALNAESCEIYSDVDGVFSADPRVVPDALKLDSLSYDEMQELASAGAKVLNAQAVEFARQKGIVIQARSTYGGGKGTPVTHKASTEVRVRGVTADQEVFVVAFGGAGEEGLLEFLDARGVRGRLLSLNSLDASKMFLVLPLQDVHGVEVLQRELSERFGTALQIRSDLGTVTCVGASILADWSTLRRSLAAAKTAQVQIQGVHSSPLQITLLAPKSQLPQLTRALHQELVG